MTRVLVVLVVLVMASVAMAALAGETPTLAVDRLVYQAPTAAESVGVVSPAVSTVIVVATPTPGPDWSATAAAIEIQAAADRAAGDAAYKVAGQIEITRQWDMATVQAGQATATAHHAATLGAIAAEGTRQALAVQADAARATATRAAVLAATVQGEQDAARAHQSTLIASQRLAEVRRERAQEWVRPVAGVTGPLLLFGLVLTGVLLMLRMALARDLADDLIAVLERFTGHFAPVIEGEIISAGLPGPPAPVASADNDRLEFLRYALSAGTYAYDQMRTAGWPGGARRWQRTMEQLQADGWAVLVKNRHGGQKYIAPGGRDILHALAHYSQTTPPPQGGALIGHSNSHSRVVAP